MLYGPHLQITIEHNKENIELFSTYEYQGSWCWTIDIRDEEYIILSTTASDGNPKRKMREDLRESVEGILGKIKGDAEIVIRNPTSQINSGKVAKFIEGESNVTLSSSSVLTEYELMYKNMFSGLYYVIGSDGDIVIRQILDMNVLDLRSGHGVVLVESKLKYEKIESITIRFLDKSRAGGCEIMKLTTLIYESLQYIIWFNPDAREELGDFDKLDFFISRDYDNYYGVYNNLAVSIVRRDLQDRPSNREWRKDESGDVSLFKFIQNYLDCIKNL